jgi:hypothetical protein
LLEIEVGQGQACHFAGAQTVVKEQAHQQGITPPLWTGGLPL